MNEEYLTGAFEHLGGEEGTGATFKEWTELIANDDDYKQGMFDYLGGKDATGVPYDEWNNFVFGEKKSFIPKGIRDIVKKKEENGEEVSEPLEEPTTSDASELTLRAPGELSFQEEEKSTPNYMGLFDKKDIAKKAQESGVSVDFYEQVGKAASQAERPLSFLNRANHIEKRLEGLRENFPLKKPELIPIRDKFLQLNSQNIDSICSVVYTRESDCFIVSKSLYI